MVFGVLALAGHGGTRRVPGLCAQRGTGSEEQQPPGQECFHQRHITMQSCASGTVPLENLTVSSKCEGQIA